ncbi:von Willebrand factor type A domain containing protein [Aphelenchoides avenae]|nr:von Willebrand factor type A domain containing protein [Aphelenchus avenae]
MTVKVELKQPQKNLKKRKNSDEPESKRYSGCVADTIFVIDSTSSVSKIFEKHIEYVKNVIELLDISPEANHVALIAYASHRKNRVRYSLSDAQSKEQALAKLQALPFIGGITATGAALDVALKELDKTRSNVGANVVVVTDGFSYDHVEDQAIHLHALENVRTFAVSIGPYRREYELVILAGNEKNVFRGFGTFRELADRLQQCIVGQTSGVIGRGGGKSDKTDEGESNGGENSVKEDNSGVTATVATVTEAEDGTDEQSTTREQVEVTNAPATSPSATSQPYEDRGSTVSGEPSEVAPSTIPAETKQHCSINVVFVIDASGSLTSRFQRQLETAIDLIDAFPQDTNTTRLSVIKFAGPKKSRIVFPFSNLLSGKDLKEQIRRIRFTGGTTYINEALVKAANELSNATDDGARQLVVVFTDGFTADDPSKAAKALHQQGIPVLAVALDGDYPVNRHDLEVIADDKSHVFYNDDIGELKSLINELANEC